MTEHLVDEQAEGQRGEVKKADGGRYAGWLEGSPGALHMIVIRIFQGVGGAQPAGLALGINNVAAIAGSFIGDLLAPISWRLVFLVSVPLASWGRHGRIRGSKSTSKRWPGSTGGGAP